MILPFAIEHPYLLLALGVPLIYFATVALGRSLRRRLQVRLGLLYLLFSVAFALWLPLFTYRQWLPGVALLPGQRHWLLHLTAAVVLLGTLFVLAMVRRCFWELIFERRHRAKAPKFLSEVISLVVFVAALLAVISIIYGQSIPGLVAGSTVLAAIIGFALQDLLGNIIAGISLEIGKPFRTGDWLVVEGDHAEVIEVNWRSTRLRTNDDIYLDLPNKHIVGAKIVNLTFPSRQHGVRLKVGFDYTVAPNFVKDCVQRAAANAHGVLANPPPKAFLKDFGDSAIIYEIRFWIDDESQHNDILDAVRTNIWYEAQRHHIRIPFPIRTVHIERHAPRRDDALDAARRGIRKQPLFEILDQAQVDALLRHARVLRFGRGEKVIEQGASGHSMFLVLEGEADVVFHADAHATRVATLHPGDCCGEMSLLTGEPRSASVVARTDCELWEIEKSVLGEILSQNAVLVEKLSELLAQRRIENEEVRASNADRAQMADRRKEYTEGFLKKLYSFFEL